MRRAAALTVLAVSLAVGAAALPIDQADAAVPSPTRPNSAFNADGTLTPDAWQIIQNPTMYPPPVPGDTTPQATVDSLANRARSDGGIIPKLGDYFAPGSKLQLGVGIGLSLATSFGISGYSQLYQLWSCDWQRCGAPDHTTAVATTSVRPAGWRRYSAGQCFTSRFSTETVTTDCAPQTGWYLSWDASYNGGAYTNDGFFQQQGGDEFNAVVALGLVGNAVVPLYHGNPDVGLLAWYATDKQYDDAFSKTPTDVNTYNNTTNHYAITNYAGTLDAASAGAAYGAIGAQTDQQKSAEGALAHSVNPLDTGQGVPADFTFLAPQPNETYSDYLTRLQAAGYVGTATEVAEATALDGYGPNAVTRVQYVGEDGVTHTLDPLRWPTTAPTARVNTAVTIRYNASSATPAPTDTGTSGWTPSTATPGGIDFGPLRSLDFGCKFPYGLFCYAKDVTGWFNVTPQAPDFNLALNDLKVGGTTFVSGLHYDVNLDVLDSYMATIRTILSVVVWVGAVWMLASRLLGLNAGDPGEAIDDGLD